MTPEEVEILLAENAALRAEVGVLRAQLQAALVRIAELEQDKPAPPPFVKPNRPQRSKEPRKKRAAEHNTSRKRSQPTRIERHVLERCPDCGYRLHGESIDYTREVIELPPPQPVDVIEHQVIKRWCPHCATWHSPQLALDGQVLGQGRIGVWVASLVSYLRTTLRLLFRLIRSLSGDAAQLAVECGGACGTDPCRAPAVAAAGRSAQGGSADQHGDAWG